MNIVVLDGYALNPGDLSWDGVASGEKIQIYERTADAELLGRAEDAEILVTNKTPINAGAIAKLPKLKMIAVTATGYNVVDVAAARSRGIPVCNVPAYSTDSVAQHTIALLLELTSRVGLHAGAVMAGAWQSSPDFCAVLSPLMELAGKKFGIVGFGSIGRRTAKIAAALGMSILVAQRKKPHAPQDFAFTELPLVELFAAADVVSLHCPLTSENGGFINAPLLAKMKPTAYLLNTARGGLVNETDLAAALRAGTIAGYGADVLAVEPPASGNVILTAPRTVLTPHIAWASAEARRRCMAITAKNVAAFVAGSPINVVNA
jgi:glycerate dehydrogenase